MSNTDFDGVIDDFLKSSTTRAVAAPTGSPERTTKALDLSARSGVPAPIIELNIEDAEKRIAAQERANAVRQSPELQTYVNSDPAAAQVSSDDYGPLQDFINEIKNFVDEDPILKATRENFDTETPLGITFGSETDQFFRDIGLFKSPDRADPGALITEPIIRGSAAAIDLLARSFVAATAGAGAGVEQLVASANEAAGQRNFFGNPKRANRELQNFVNFWLLKMGFDSPVMMNPEYPLSQRTFRFLEKAQETKPVPKGEPPKAPWQVDPAQLQLEYITTKAEFDTAQLDAAVQTVVETATRERAPQMIQALTQQSLGDRTVGVSAQALQDVYKSMGVVPGVGDPIMGFVPDIAERLRVGLATGADVEVPYAAYLAYIDPKIHDGLIPFIRSRGGMTIDEAKLAQEEMQAAIEARKGQKPIEGEIITPEQQLINDEVQEVLAAGKMDQTGDQTVLNAAIKAVEDDIASGEPFAPNGALNVDVLNALKKMESDEVSMVDGATPKAIPADAGPVEAGVTEKVNELYLNPLFRDAESAGMTKSEFATYSKRLETVTTAAREADIRRIQRQTERELTQEWKTTYGQEVAKAETEFDSRRDVVAARFIRYGALERGTATGQAVPLNIDALGGVSLPKGMATRDGVEPDEIAGLLGYQTGAELVADLGRLTAEQGRKTEESFRTAVTSALARERAMERFGDPSDRAQQVIDMIAEEDLSSVLYDELRVMQKQGGGEPLTLDEMEAWAEREFNKLPVNQARNAKKWGDAVVRNGREAELALLKGDVQLAFKAKNKQLVSTLFLQNAIAFERNLPRGVRIPKEQKPVDPNATPVVKRRRAVTGPKKKSPRVLIKTYIGNLPASVSPEYGIQIQKILQGFGFRTKADPEDIARAEPLSEFIAAKTEEGWEPAIAYQLYDPLFYKPLDQLTVEEFDAVIDSLRSLDYLGREALKIQRAGEKADLDATIAEIEARVATLPFRRTTESGVGEGQKRIRYMIDSRLVKMEEIMDDLDLQDPHGPLNESVFVPVVKGEYREMELFKETAERLKNVRLANPNRTVINTEFLNPMSGSLDARNPYRFTRADVAMMALNYGNPRNRELLINTLVPMDTSIEVGAALKALDYQAAEAQVLAFIDRNMTKEDWDYVQALWKYFEWIKPQVDEVYLRTSGVAPDTVEGSSFMTSHGQMEGGYAPIISDPQRSKAAGLKEKSLFDSSYHKATTPNGYTKPRSEGSLDPLLMQGAYGVLQHRIRAMLHDIALREPVIQAGQILYNRKVREAVNRHYGAEYVETFGPWLRYVANHFNEEDKLLGIVGQMMRIGRQNMAIVVLGMNLKTILSPNVGPALRGLKDLGVTPADMNYGSMNWKEINEFAQSRSLELQQRKANLDRDISDVLRNVVGMASPYKRMQQRAAEFGMALTAGIDTYLATIVWNAEYRNARARGESEDQAIDASDKMVRKYHGSASPANLAQLFRGGETTKTLTVFMQFMNMIYNRQRSMVRMGRSGIEQVQKGDNAGAKRDFVKLLSDFFVITIPTALFNIVYDPGLVDEDNWGKTVGQLLLSSLMGSLPFARELYSAWVQQLPPRNIPIVQMLDSVRLATQDLEAAVDGDRFDDPSEKWLKHAINVPGYLLGLPTGQLANSSQFLWNVSIGEDEMDNFGDFLRGIVYGTSEPGK